MKTCADDEVLDSYLVTAAPPETALAGSRNGHKWLLYNDQSQSTIHGFSAAGSNTFPIGALLCFKLVQQWPCSEV